MWSVRTLLIVKVGYDVTAATVLVTREVSGPGPPSELRISPGHLPGLDLDFSLDSRRSEC